MRDRHRDNVTVLDVTKLDAAKDKKNAPKGHKMSREEIVIMPERRLLAAGFSYTILLTPFIEYSFRSLSRRSLNEASL